MNPMLGPPTLFPWVAALTKWSIPKPLEGRSCLLLAITSSKLPVTKISSLGTGNLKSTAIFTLLIPPSYWACRPRSSEPCGSQDMRSRAMRDGKHTVLSPVWKIQATVEETVNWKIQMLRKRSLYSLVSSHSLTTLIKSEKVSVDMIPPHKLIK